MPGLARVLSVKGVQREYLKHFRQCGRVARLPRDLRAQPLEGTAVCPHKRPILA
jgi:hypothetical protein